MADPSLETGNDGIDYDRCALMIEHMTVLLVEKHKVGGCLASADGKTPRVRVHNLTSDFGKTGEVEVLQLAFL
jgi:hypothetical protein